MESINLTDPNNPRGTHHESVRSWDYKESVVSHLRQFGVPLQTAEVAVIDLKGLVNTCHKGKLTSTQAATMIFENALASYKNGDGSWRFAK